MDSQNLKLTYHGFLSALTGVRYPMPNYYQQWPMIHRIFWNIYILFGNFIMITELISLFIRVGTSYQDLGVFCACNVAIGYILQYLLKIIIFWRKDDVFQRLFKELQIISMELNNNPLNDKNFQGFYNDIYKKVMVIGTAKGTLEFIGNFGLIAIFIVISIVHEVPENKITPALSWTPYNNGENPVYSLTCFFEFLVFGSVTVKNAVIDILFWAMLVVPTIQLKYLEHLLKIVLEKNEKIVEVAEDKEESREIENHKEEKDRFKELTWWIHCHQKILR